MNARTRQQQAETAAALRAMNARTQQQQAEAAVALLAMNAYTQQQQAETAAALHAMNVHTQQQQAETVAALHAMNAHTQQAQAQTVATLQGMAAPAYPFQGVRPLYGGGAPSAGVGGTADSVGTAAEVLVHLVGEGGGVAEVLGLSPGPDVVAAVIGGLSGMAGL